MGREEREGERGKGEGVGMWTCEGDNGGTRRHSQRRREQGGDSRRRAGKGERERKGERAERGEGKGRGTERGRGEVNDRRSMEGVWVPVGVGARGEGARNGGQENFVETFER